MPPPERLSVPEQTAKQSLDESEPSGEVCPLGQELHEVRLDVSYLPAGQLQQPLMPELELYWPAEQLRHDE